MPKKDGNYLGKEKEGIVYLLWGSKAQEKAAKIDEKHNLILKSVHPSPLSAYRGFFGCKHFSKTNEYLIAQRKNPINW
jgi:uracil-DNA glycosylase